MLLINAAAMLSPVVNSGDSVTYATLAQHIVVHNDWTNLILDDRDWLDKPHLPFWITALFFKLGGISAFTYILPGFLFHLIGGYFTYRLARLFYERDAAWLAVLVYVSVFHLMDTSIEVKAETYLTAFIMGACYYWLRYDAQAKLKYLLLGAGFSAMAMMTKGLFTLFTIGSGLLCLWAYRGQLDKLWSAKWWLAVMLSLLLTAPELIALYRQFDAHPEKLVFGHSEVSGIKFFFWDGQFGRFLNTGPIQNRNGTSYYFVSVFLWAFLPWTAAFIAATYANIREFSSLTPGDKGALAFLYGAFLATFVLFSATSFQLDYYTVIIFPFAAIICGNFLARELTTLSAHSRLPFVQLAITILLVGLSVGLSVYIANTTVLGVVLAISALLLLYAYLNRQQWRANALVVYPLFGIAAAYLFVALTTALTFTSSSIAYNANVLLRKKSDASIYVYRMNLVAHELGLYTPLPCYAVDSPAELPTAGQRYFLVVQAAQLASLQQSLGQIDSIAQGKWVLNKTGLFSRLLRLAKGTEPLEDIRIVQVEGSQ